MSSNEPIDIAEVESTNVFHWKTIFAFSLNFNVIKSVIDSKSDIKNIDKGLTQGRIM